MQTMPRFSGRWARYGSRISMSRSACAIHRGGRMAPGLQRRPAAAGIPRAPATVEATGTRASVQAIARTLPKIRMLNLPASVQRRQRAETIFREWGVSNYLIVAGVDGHEWQRASHPSIATNEHSEHAEEHWQHRTSQELQVRVSPVRNAKFASWVPHNQLCFPGRLASCSVT